ncbi:branched-chain amino acid ABC transporter permease protein [Succinatimonas sp. CAG:777]|jgi:putative multiple sugar transport system permease protein|uniref:multiple monosaccharide ABC transporter permease n=1 Tax=Succinivibrio sp. TaxID=2053619 RepID=UPI0003399006|nr:sugar ABC transporter permease [Succinivibrio sp.]CCX92818.1 branched-chain amino acid ABC transporter permease protein [Succinatimonas sp. CAG:777]
MYILNMLKRNTLLIALILVMILFEIAIQSTGHGSLFSPSNFTNIIYQNSYVIILAVGMLFLIIGCGNIDLSVGSIVALVGAVAGVLMVNNEYNIYMSMALCLLLGIVIGAWHGFWIAYIRIPSFIVTLAGMLLFRGLALIVLDGITINPFPADYLTMFTSYFPSFGPGYFQEQLASGLSRAEVRAGMSAIVFSKTMTVTAVIVIAYLVGIIYSRVSKIKKGYEVVPLYAFLFQHVLALAAIIASCILLGENKGIPVILILIAVVVIVYAFIANKTVVGRRIYALGGNEKAAKLSGVNTSRLLFLSYVNMGLLAAVAALVCVARFNSASPMAGTGYELDAIGACFIGGASAYGGVGTVGGAVIGAIFMGVLNNGMSILGIDANWQKAVKGLVLLAAVVTDVMSKKRVTN